MLYFNYLFFYFIIYLIDVTIIFYSLLKEVKHTSIYI